MRQDEYHHHTKEQIYDYLTEALRIVARLELDDDLKAIAFSRCIDLLASKQIFYEQASLGVPHMVMPGTRH